jgi:osmotically-inducible protein OsmY
LDRKQLPRIIAVNRLCAVSLATVVATLVGGCDPITTAAVGGAAAVGVGSAEERGLEGAVDDTKIRAEINELWLKQDFEMYRNVTLTINEGRVMLTGSVKRPEARVEAVRLAWQAAGVRQVLDEIQVEDQSGFSDYARDVWIANSLRTRLMFDEHVRNINYTVDVVNGVVYLMGIARSAEELDRVIAHARDISDVKRVVSHVVLKNDPKRQS